MLLKLILFLAAAGSAYLAAGKLAAIAVALFLLVAVPLARRRFASARDRRDALRYARGSRSVRRLDYYPYPGKARSHPPTDACDGWCDDPDGDKVSTLTRRRREQHRR